MSDKKIGRVAWMDLTIDDATKVSEFYSKVVGWDIQGFDMGGYNDYCMNDPETGETLAGVCNAKGSNAGIPPVWMMYIGVEDLNSSLKTVTEQGGKILGDKRADGKGGHYQMIQDPAGAYLTLWQQGSNEE